MAKKKNKSKSTRVSLEKSVSSGLTGVRNDQVLALSSEKSLALLKLCRLCESKDGPFLNIFEDGKVTARKMDRLLPFSVSEQDGLPNKICFRCSAKVEELHEFVQKCTTSQENLQRVLGTNTVVVKHKMRLLWEENLSKSKMSNDDICEKIVKQAMERFKDIPIISNITNEEEEIKKPIKQRVGIKREFQISTPKDYSEDIDNVPLKKIKSLDNQADRQAGKSPGPSNTPEPPSNETSSKIKSKGSSKINEIINVSAALETPKKEQNFIPTKNLLTFDYDDNSNSSNSSKKETDKNKIKVTLDTEEKKNEKPFDIMEHVSTIKVNGVGILFQCKLCNRNFLKKEVVIAHGCAKTGIPKVDLTKNVTPPPELPKVPSVKYINTKTDVDLKGSTLNKPDEIKTPTVNKPKPKIGPASKVRRNDSDSKPTVGMVVQPKLEIPPTTPTVPSINTTNTSAINISNAPSINSRYKLVPGPNNTFSLVEESNPTNAEQDDCHGKNSKKRKQSSKSELRASIPINTEEVIDLDDNEPAQVQSSSKPYPINFFTSSPQMSSAASTPELTEKTHPSHSQSSQVLLKPVTNPVVPTPQFTTPAMKKQSYTIVQTGNPSKLLISTKPPPQNTTPIEEPKRKTRKSKHEVKEDTQKQPFNVILEEASPPKDAGFFTFVNIDPLLQPAYGVPGDKIIQESQITTSTSVEKGRNSDGKYACNMCKEVFSREKKLLTHIQAHYSKMDEEDKVRTGGKCPKKKGKRSTT